MCIVIFDDVAAAAAEVYFYDAVENVEDLASLSDDDEECNKGHRSVDLRLSRLQSRLANICQRKATIRNKKVSLCLCLCTTSVMLVLHCGSLSVARVIG